jgi:hypothetical protein
MSEPVKIVIVLEGGMIQEVLSCGVRVEYAVIDYDCDATDESDVVQIPQSENKYADATGHVSDADINYPARASQLFEIMTAHQAR